MKREIGSFFGILLIFFFAVLLGGGALAYFYTNQPTSYDYEVQETDNTKSKDKAVTIDETADWETLKSTTNFDDGKPITFTVKYPSGWKIKTDVKGNKYLTHIVDDKEYSIEFLSGSGGVTWDADYSEEADVVLGEKNFNKVSWFKDNKIIVISYIVKDSPAPFESILASIPTKDNFTYIALYDKMLNTLSYPVR